MRRPRLRLFLWSLLSSVLQEHSSIFNLHHLLFSFHLHLLMERVLLEVKSRLLLHWVLALHLIKVRRLNSVGIASTLMSPCRLLFWPLSMYRVMLSCLLQKEFKAECRKLRRASFCQPSPPLRADGLHLVEELHMPPSLDGIS